MKITFKDRLSPGFSLLLALAILLLTIMVVLWPLAVIWALNTLFVLSIPTTFWTWLATWVVLISLQVARVSNK